MKHINKSILIATACLAAIPSYASEPLSFDYLVTGSQVLRPSLVFHDGVNTYVQPPEWAGEAARIKGADAERYGSYWLVKGIPEKFSLQHKKEVVTISLLKPSSAKPGDRGMARSSWPSQEQKYQAETVGVSKREACAPQALRTEKTFIVGFDHGSRKLTESMAIKIERALGGLHDISAVRIRVPLERSRDETVARGEAVRGLLARLGVPVSLIETDYRGNPTLGTELLIKREKNLGCLVDGRMVANIPTWDQATVIAEGNAEEVIKRIAEAAGLIFRTEGTTVTANVTASFVDKPLPLILEKIADQLVTQADLILRKHEIVIRYRNPS